MTDGPISDSEYRTRWEQTMDWPLTIAALLFLAVFAIPILGASLEPIFRRSGTPSGGHSPL